jgi:hypothetical protein
MFADKSWLSSPEPFPISRAMLGEIERLGHRLHVFLTAANSIYYRSVKGKLPPWIAHVLDAGKPPWLLEAARHPSLRDALPTVIRPDLLLTEQGFALTEIDSVPGGIGLTAWLAQTYAALSTGASLVGGARGMLDGFASLFPQGADILVSQESGDYRPEMAWLCEQLGDAFALHAAESYTARHRDVYRFFELFDHAQIPGLPDLLAAHAAGRGAMVAPAKPWLEEKLWLALFWARPLRELWRQELRENQRDALAKIIPFGWTVDPSPLPPHGVFPRLDAQTWDDVAAFSQKDRQLVLKLSGFSEQAWGSRSVVIGHDVSTPEWRAALDTAQREFATHPWVIQEFRPALIVEHPYFDATSGDVRTMRGRVRLCPYFFVADGRTITLGGILATIVPADKKIIHGMKDGIIVPCRVLD